MTLQETYEQFGGDFEGVMSRLPKEELVERFVRKFLTEPSYGNLVEGIREKDCEKSFRGAHSLKGVCANLGFSRLENSSKELTEFLREKQVDEVDWTEVAKLQEQIDVDYKEVIRSIQAYVEA